MNGNMRLCRPMCGRSSDLPTELLVFGGYAPMRGAAPKTLIERLSVGQSHHRTSGGGAEEQIRQQGVHPCSDDTFRP